VQQIKCDVSEPCKIVRSGADAVSGGQRAKTRQDARLDAEGRHQGVLRPG